MRSLLLFWLFLLAFSSVTKAQSALETMVLEKENQWANAVKDSDISALDKIYDDQLTYTHSDDRVDTKDSYIENLKAGITSYQKITSDDIKCVVHGKTAIVTSHTVFNITSKGNPVVSNTRMIHVWVKKGRDWKLVAHQTTKLL